MSRKRKLPKYRVPKDNDLSSFIYLDANGDLMHIMFDSGSIAGVFQWEDYIDFFVEYGSPDNFNYGDNF